MGSRMTKRGVFIVFEGLDRTGKTTQSKRLADVMDKSLGRPTQTIRYPNRESATGQIIDGYLKNTTNLKDEAIHLLYSANRWESVPSMREQLDKGVSLICDRYCYSGVAYSAAKGLSLDWCKAPDASLPQPDMVFFIDLSPEEAQKRGSYGEERYEKLEFQKKVYDVFTQLKQPWWTVINGNQTMDEIHEEIVASVQKVLAEKESSEMSEIKW